MHEALNILTMGKWKCEFSQICERFAWFRVHTLDSDSPLKPVKIKWSGQRAEQNLKALSHVVLNVLNFTILSV